MRARILAAALLSLLPLALLVACKDDSPTLTAAPGAAIPPEPTAMPSARRPARRYYLTRTPARCEITRVDEAGTSTPVPTPCPGDLQLGERLRIAGKTCTRESADLERVEPVVCPDPLTNQEKHDLGLK